MDEARIYVKAGDGGNGVVAFRREKFVPQGGPAGGNGGKGGSVYLRVNGQDNTLIAFQGGIHFRAERGLHGSGNNMQGRSGEDLFIDVPPGTIVRDAETGDILGDLTKPDDILLVAPGGRGGRGNAVFKSNANQAPRISEKGEPGTERWLTLELKLIADVGLVGLPNAGKSTLLSVISAARPKIADYPFTTITPNLGVVSVGDLAPFVVADIPGLVEGAHEGRGLGDQFLRHIERTKLIIHLLDASAADPLVDFDTINEELESFSDRLATRPQLVVLTKMDIPEAADKADGLQETLEGEGYEVTRISAVTNQGVRELTYRIRQLLDELPEPAPVIEEAHIYRPLEDENQFAVQKESDDTYVVRGVAVERWINMLNPEQEEAMSRFQRQLKAMGITTALQRAGVQAGDTVRIGELEFEWML